MLVGGKMKTTVKFGFLLLLTIIIGLLLRGQTEAIVALVSVIYFFALFLVILPDLANEKEIS
jgi:hypothetical protein